MDYCCGLDKYLRARNFDFSKHLRNGTAALDDHQYNGSGPRIGSVSWYEMKFSGGMDCDC